MLAITSKYIPLFSLYALEFSSAFNKCTLRLTFPTGNRMLNWLNGNRFHLLC